MMPYPHDIIWRRCKTKEEKEEDKNHSKTQNFKISTRYIHHPKLRRSKSNECFASHRIVSHPIASYRTLSHQAGKNIVHSKERLKIGAYAPRESLLRAKSDHIPGLILPHMARHRREEEQRRRAPVCRPAWSSTRSALWWSAANWSTEFFLREEIKSCVWGGGGAGDRARGGGGGIERQQGR